jgi:hypothetical protein
MASAKGSWPEVHDAAWSSLMNVFETLWLFSICRPTSVLLDAIR